MNRQAFQTETPEGGGAGSGLARLRVALLALVVLLLLAAVFVACLNPIWVTDFWWQAKTGELIVRTGRIPTRDPFSWTGEGNPWMVHEWVTELLFYGMLTGVPREALLLYKCGLACIACGLVLIRAWRRSGSAPLALGVTFLAALVVRSYADLRPQMLTFVLLAGLLLGLDLYRAGGWRRLPWWLPPLFVLWANLHGGAVVGLILLTLWVAGEALGRRFLGEKGEGVPALALSTAACWATLILNPNGWHIYTYPFHVLGHPEVQGYIVEWFSPDFHAAAAQPFEIMLLLLIGVLGLGRRGGDDTRVPLGELLVLAAMTHAALLAQRNTAPFALAAAPVIAAGAASLWRSADLGALRDFTSRPPVRLLGLVSSCGALLFAINYYTPRLPVRQWVDYGIAMDRFPVDAARWMKTGKWPGKLYNDYVWGGYLIWELYPQRRVFIDGRAEVYYPGGVFDDEMRIHRVDDGWDAALRRRGVEVVLTQSHDRLAAALRRSPGWELAFTGKVESVFTRKPKVEP